MAKSHAAVEARDWNGLLRIAEAAMEQAWVRLPPHHFAAIAYEGLGDRQRAQFHRAWFDGLVRSILDSGDGRAAATAYVVISIEEEYDVLALRSLRRERQALSQIEGRPYDVLTVIDREGRSSSVYFDITLMMARTPFAPTPSR